MLDDLDEFNRAWKRGVDSRWKQKMANDLFFLLFRYGWPPFDGYGF